MIAAGHWSFELTSGTFEYAGVSADVYRRSGVGVVAVELLPRQYRRRVPGETVR
jgi:hypothetical protein